MKQLRNLDKDGIAGVMAMRIVDLLEVIEINQQQGKRCSVPAGERKAGAKLLGKHAPVGQRGQYIVVSDLLKTPMALLQFGRAFDDQLFQPLLSHNQSVYAVPPKDAAEEEGYEHAAGKKPPGEPPGGLDGKGEARR